MQSDMPFRHRHGRAYYRHWAAAEPRAAVVFLHGFGEHTGLYHRYGFALNAAGIDLWAVDQFGHGLSPGDRGDFGDARGELGARRPADRAGEGRTTRASRWSRRDIRSERSPRCAG